MASLCNTLRNLFRYVILDSPPVGAVADYDLIQAVSDGVILVVRPDHTNRNLCRKAMEYSCPRPNLQALPRRTASRIGRWRHAGADYYYWGTATAATG